MCLGQEGKGTLSFLGLRFLGLGSVGSRWQAHRVVCAEWPVLGPGMQGTMGAQVGDLSSETGVFKESLWVIASSSLYYDTCMAQPRLPMWRCSLCCQPLWIWAIVYSMGADRAPCRK